MEKESLIKKFYGDDYFKAKHSEYGIDERGFSNFYNHGNETFLNGYEIFCGNSPDDIVKVRPIGLGEAIDNLENNNGWIKIKNDDDFPIEEAKCWCIDKGEIKEMIIPSKNGRTKYWINNITHYQIIKKPKLPFN